MNTTPTQSANVPNVHLYRMDANQTTLSNEEKAQKIQGIIDEFKKENEALASRHLTATQMLDEQSRTISDLTQKVGALKADVQTEASKAAQNNRQVHQLKMQVIGNNAIVIGGVALGGIAVGGGGTLALTTVTAAKVVAFVSSALPALSALGIYMCPQDVQKAVEISSGILVKNAHAGFMDILTALRKEFAPKEKQNPEPSKPEDAAQTQEKSVEEK